MDGPPDRQMVVITNYWTPLGPAWPIKVDDLGYVPVACGVDRSGVGFTVARRAAWVDAMADEDDE